ncbi:30S ribosomal protein S8 [Candidatus Daviesbacteria bacterium]|nr:30S ribosomal protein S8 [Candidatus Daviesbacteria bacterium]
MVTDTVADALIRIKNGYKALKTEVWLPYSNLVFSICKVLERESYISKLEEFKDENSPFRKIKVVLKYENEFSSSSKRKPAITEVRRISKPGLRIYRGQKALPRVLNGLGVAIISTPKGVMTDKEARKEGVGGEVLAYVW